MISHLTGVHKEPTHRNTKMPNDIPHDWCTNGNTLQAAGSNNAVSSQQCDVTLHSVLRNDSQKTKNSSVFILFLLMIRIMRDATCINHHAINERIGVSTASSNQPVEVLE